MGQRPLADHEESTIVRLLVPKSERDRLRRAATANLQTFSQFARDALAEAASETLEDEGESAASE